MLPCQVSMRDIGLLLCNVSSLSVILFSDLLGGLRPHLSTEHVKKPNSFVAHLRDGLAVVHLYTGRLLCRLALLKGLPHVDVDGDGVVGMSVMFVVSESFFVLRLRLSLWL